MKAAIYTPYLDTLGGGERYMLSIARALLETGWNVDIQTQSSELLDKAQKQFGFSLKGINGVPSVNRGEGYDLCIWLSDGSIPTLYSRKNILHFQRPFMDVDGKSLLSRMKFFRISKVVVNSEFTKSFIDKAYPTNSVVLYPPVDVAKFSGARKDKTIIYIGRFSQLEQSKRQDVLLKAFVKFYRFYARDWRLIMAGGSLVGRTDEVDILREHAKGHPIEIFENPTFATIQKLLSHSTLFWSAAGYGVNEQTEPQKCEHFGITVVEAMAAKCIPIVYDGGGHREIIQPEVSGFLWKNPQDMLTYTKRLIKEKDLVEQMSQAAATRSKIFSYEVFKDKFLQLL